MAKYWYSYWFFKEPALRSLENKALVYDKAILTGDVHLEKFPVIYR